MLDAPDIEAIVAPVTLKGCESGVVSYELPEGSRNSQLTTPNSGGWLFDPATGEVLGHAGAGDRFAIDSTEAAEWALELRSRIEADIAALDARLEALRANLLALRQEQVRRLAWWEWRFGSQLVDFARRALAGGKRRTWTCAWGRVCFRKSKGRTEILDMDAAVRLVEVWDPALIKVEQSVTVTAVTAALEALARACGEEPERPNWLKLSGESETATIDTGIKRIQIKKGDEDDN